MATKITRSDGIVVNPLVGEMAMLLLLFWPEAAVLTLWQQAPQEPQVLAQEHILGDVGQHFPNVIAATTHIMPVMLDNPALAPAVEPERTIRLDLQQTALATKYLQVKNPELQQWLQQTDTGLQIPLSSGSNQPAALDLQPTFQLQGDFVLDLLGRIDLERTTAETRGELVITASSEPPQDTPTAPLSNKSSDFSEPPSPDKAIGLALTQIFGGAVELTTQSSRGTRLPNRKLERTLSWTATQSEAFALRLQRQGGALRLLIQIYPTQADRPADWQQDKHWRELRSVPFDVQTPISLNLGWRILDASSDQVHAEREPARGRWQLEQLHVQAQQWLDFTSRLSTIRDEQLRATLQSMASETLQVVPFNWENPNTTETKTLALDEVDQVVLANENRWALSWLGQTGEDAVGADLEQLAPDGLQDCWIAIYGLPSETPIRQVTMFCPTAEQMPLWQLQPEEPVIGVDDSGKRGASRWQSVSFFRQVPPAAEQVRLLLRGYRQTGTQNDAYFDDLFFRVGAGPNLIRNPGAEEPVVADGAIPHWQALAEPWKALAGNQVGGQKAPEGKFYFAAGEAETATLEQIVDLTDQQTSIRAGEAWCFCGGMLGNHRKLPYDQPQLTFMYRRDPNRSVHPLRLFRLPLASDVRVAFQPNVELEGKRLFVTLWLQDNTTVSLITTVNSSTLEPPTSTASIPGNVADRNPLAVTVYLNNGDRIQGILLSASDTELRLWNSTTRLLTIPIRRVRGFHRSPSQLVTQTSASSETVNPDDSKAVAPMEQTKPATGEATQPEAKEKTETATGTEANETTQNGAATASNPDSAKTEAASATQPAPPANTEADKPTVDKEKLAADFLIRFEERRQLSDNRDLLFLQRDDGGVSELEVLFLEADEKQIRVMLDDQERTLPWDRLLGVLLAVTARRNTAQEINPLEELRHTLTLRQGDKWSGNWEAFDPERGLTLRLAWDQTVTFLPSEVQQIDAVGTRRLFLSQLEPVEIEEIPYFNWIRSYRRDQDFAGQPIQLGSEVCRRGLATTSRTVLTYELAGQFERFETLLGFAAKVDPRAHVIVRIYGDDQTLATFGDELRPGKPPLEVKLNVKNYQMLTLEVDFGNYENIGDEILWGNPRLYR